MKYELLLVVVVDRNGIGMLVRALGGHVAEVDVGLDSHDMALGSVLELVGGVDRLAQVQVQGLG